MHPLAGEKPNDFPHKGGQQQFALRIDRRNSDPGQRCRRSQTPEEDDNQATGTGRQERCFASQPSMRLQRQPAGFTRQDRSTYGLTRSSGVTEKANDRRAEASRPHTSPCPETIVRLAYRSCRGKPVNCEISADCSRVRTRPKARSGLPSDRAAKVATTAEERLQSGPRTPDARVEFYASNRFVML